jgi:hypothetical protein
MLLEYNASMKNKTIETSKPVRAINENRPIHFPNRESGFSKAYENLQHLLNSWALRSKSKDV